MIDFPFFNTEKLCMLSNIDEDFKDKGFLSLNSVNKHLIEILKNKDFLSNKAFMEDEDDADFDIIKDRFDKTEKDYLIKNNYRLKISSGTSCYVVGGLYEPKDGIVELGVLFVEYVYSETYIKFINIENLNIVDLNEVESELKEVINNKIIKLQKEIDYLKI